MFPTTLSTLKVEIEPGPRTLIQAKQIKFSSILNQKKVIEIKGLQTWRGGEQATTLSFLLKTERNWVFVINSDFIIPISLQPNPML